jgi:acyl-CoA thioester hydrolase
MLRQHEIEIRVRYQETDAQGRVHHANYLTYFEMGRVEILRASGYSYRRMEEEGVFLVVAEIACRYRRGAAYDDLLRLVTATRRAHGVRIWHDYQLFRGSELLVTGESVLACVTRDGQLQRLPAWLLMEEAESE